MNGDAKHTWYARPVFFVADCEASSAFYQDLGFREDWRSSHDGEVVAVQVSRADVEVILSLDFERAGGGRVLFALEQDFALRVEKELAAEGVETQRAYWGMPVLVVRDLDGNDLVFTDDALSAGEGAPRNS